MRTTIDAAGRVVIPKALRDRLGLTAGTELDVALDDEEAAVALTPVPVQWRVVERPDGNGVVLEADRPVETVTTETVAGVLDDVRSERSRRLLE